MPTPLTLQVFRVDRTRVVDPGTGIVEQGVALVLVDSDLHEFFFSISAVDAKRISHLLSEAANEAQEAKRREQGA